MKRIAILGVTGSIGTQALDVIRRQKEDYELYAISAHSNLELVVQIIMEFSPKFVAITERHTYDKVKEFCRDNNQNIEVLHGMDGLTAIATLEEVELVLTSVVGMVGLLPTMKAIEKGKHIALANKETLVVAGEIIIPAAMKNNVQLLPVDSEHCAIYQCLQGNDKSKVSRIILTASGGPFRGKTINDLQNASLEDALKHPRWNMGRKISVDSATLMNKGLEVIEAHWLFDMDYSDIEVVVHPESIVHSMVEYRDGSVIAQLGNTDMRLPIQYALNYPNRAECITERLNFSALGKLTFEKPDSGTFKCLKLAYDAGRAGKLAPTILNAANEEAVANFLKKKIKFLDISYIIEDCINKFEYSKEVSLESILDMEYRVREYIKNKY